jgi:hypothetical protein
MKALLLAGLLAATDANAACLNNWEVLKTPIGRDHKAIHLLGSAGVTYLVSEATGNVWMGVAAGAAVGLAREKEKIDFGGSCEWTSIAFDAAGVALGYTASKHWHFRPLSGGWQVDYTLQF